MSITWHEARESERTTHIRAMMRMIFLRMVFPLESIFVVADIIFYPQFFGLFLIVRLLCIPVWFIMEYWIQKAKTLRGVQSAALFGIVGVALSVNYVIWKSETVSWGYYPGLLLMTTASISFVPFTKRFQFFSIAVILLPYYIGFVYSHPNDLLILLLNSFFILSTFVAAYFGSRYNETLREKELVARLALAIEIEHRDQIIEKKTKEALALEISMRESQILGDIARQVSHDIRSPISAMNLVVGSLKDLPAAKIDLLSDSVRRINEIANDLLARSKTVFKRAASAVQQVSMLDLYNVADDVLAEKKIRWREKKIVFELKALSKDERIFIVVDEVRLRRTLSNLVNNSIEALGDQGKVEVIITRAANEMVLEIRDNGRGIPMDVLPKLMTEGFTFGKSNGNGLGLYSAKRDIESWGGSIRITSAVDSGTTIAIRLPLLS